MIPVELVNKIIMMSRPKYPFIKQLKRYKKNSEDNKERYKSFSHFYFSIMF